MGVFLVWTDIIEFWVDIFWICVDIRPNWTDIFQFRVDILSNWTDIFVHRNPYIRVQLGTTGTVPMVPQKNTSPARRGATYFYLTRTSIAFLSCRSFFSSRIASITFASIALAVFSLMVPVDSILFACWKAFTAMTVSPLK